MKVNCAGNPRRKGTYSDKIALNPDSVMTGELSLDELSQSITWSLTNSGVIFSWVVACSNGNSNDAWKKPSDSYIKER
jgi:hypothetical protein